MQRGLRSNTFAAMSAHQTKILIVDDDDDIRGLLTGFLAEEGFIASGVSNASGMDVNRRGV